MTIPEQVPFMSLENAVEVVLDLARQGSLSSPNVNEPEEVDASYQQETAISVVEDFFVNNVFDGKD
tara:strand:- start:191 stop:388 length:198 start_codon:yes stop_codon:yes gene_type:complete